MIAVWMAYTLAAGTLIASACWLLERLAGTVRMPTRAIWAGGMVAMLVTAAIALVPDRAASPTASPSATAAASSREAAAKGEAMPSQDVVGLRQRVAGALLDLDTQVAAATRRLARWDPVILMLWALTAALLCGVVAHAALEGRRLREGLQARNVAGTRVLLTDDVGPSATGVGTATILLPRWALDLDDSLMTLLLRHEREHLAARDPLLLLGALLSVVLVPWHLPLWWSRRRLRLAIEVDCDRRVLRAHPDVRRYGQLLLLAAQRSPSPAWANHAVATMVAPLQPGAAHLARRISVMTKPRASRVLPRALSTITVVVAIATLVVALPTPRSALAQAAVDQERALVQLTSVGWLGTDASPPSILIYTTGGGRVGIGTDAPTAIVDTLRLSRLPAMTADVTDGDVHIEVSGPGMMRLGGKVTGGRALEVSATGRHIVLLKGGLGIEGR